MNTLVIIPAHNPKNALVSHVESLICQCAQVIVVDDASSAKYNSLFEEISYLPGVTVIRHTFRQGRNAALRTALEYYDAHLAPIRAMNIDTEISDDYYAAAHVLRIVRAGFLAAGAVITDRIDAIGDVILQIPIRRAMH